MFTFVLATCFATSLALPQPSHTRVRAVAMCYYRGNSYHDGEDFFDVNGSECTCRHGSISCVGGPVYPELRCEFEGRMYENGASLLSRNGVSCTCDRGTLLCSEFSCIYNSYIYRDGDDFYDNKGLSCKCYQGYVLCAGISATTSRHICEFQDKMFSVGETFDLNDRERCTCRKTVVACEYDPEFAELKPGFCNFLNRLYRNGETFQLSENETCECNNGQVACIQGPGDFNGNKYQDGDTFALEDITCTCSNRLVTCQ